MTTRMTLTGFIRRLPGILSFVTPVFNDDLGRAHAQTSRENTNAVSGFVLVNTDEDFIEVDFRICVSIGDAPLYGFETSDRTILAGSARPLSEQLKQMMAETPDYRAAMPHTSEMIDRFVRSAGKPQTESPHECLYHLGRIHLDEPYRLTHVTVTPERRRWDRTLKSRADAIEWLAGVLDPGHEKQLVGHTRTTLQIHDLIRSSSDEMRTTRSLADAIRHVSAASSMSAGRRMYGTHRLCDACFTEIEQLFAAHRFLEDRPAPSQANVRSVIDRMLSAAPDARKNPVVPVPAGATGATPSDALSKVIEEGVLDMQSTNRSFSSTISRGIEHAARVSRV